MIALAGQYNSKLACLRTRRFDKRFTTGGQPIAIHEFLYPLIQIRDSVRPERRR